MRKLQKHRSRDQWWYFFGKAIENGKWHTARSNILFGTPILKFIDEKEIDFLTVYNENNMRTNQPKKALYLCQHCSKSYKKELPFAKYISRYSTPDEEASSKDESTIGM